MTNKPDLRDLARKIRAVAEAHPCYSQAHLSVAELESHLCAIAAVHELDKKLTDKAAELENIKRLIGDGGGWKQSAYP